MTNRPMKYPLLGHIPYVYNETTRSALFYPSITKRTAIVKYNGEEVCRFSAKLTGTADLISYIEDLGYEVTIIYTEDTGTHLSKSVITIPCQNTECKFFRDRRAGLCNIKINASVERDNGKRSKRTPTGILLTFGAKDLSELNRKTACLVKYLEETTGINSTAYVYSKLGAC